MGEEPISTAPPWGSSLDAGRQPLLILQDFATPRGDRDQAIKPTYSNPSIEWEFAPEMMPAETV